MGRLGRAMLTLQRHHDANRSFPHSERTRASLPLLIQVPTIEVGPRGYAGRRPSATHFRTKKRRLRKEVKLVGLGLLLGIPLTLLALSPMANWANSGLMASQVAAQVEFGPTVPLFSISVETISPTSSASASSSTSIETIPNITLQGFVLPDREVEESNHAGG